MMKRTVTKKTRQETADEERREAYMTRQEVIAEVAEGSYEDVREWLYEQIAEIKNDSCSE